MQNAGMAALGLDWRYLAFEVLPDDLSAAISGAGAMRFLGVNLTVPHKLIALEMVDELDDSARAWGAVNTIRFEGRTPAQDWQPLSGLKPEEIMAVRSRGFNTDADAIVRSIREDLGISASGASVLVLGAGGAGRTAALRLAAEGVGQLFLVNRTQLKAAELATEIQRRFSSTQVRLGYPPGPVDLVLNATSLGLNTDDPLPYEPSQFALSNATAVYDMIYRPSETPLLRAAKAAGRRTANGAGMLLYQGAKALEIWSGMPAPIDAMRKALQRNLYGN